MEYRRNTEVQVKTWNKVWDFLTRHGLGPPACYSTGVAWHIMK